MNPNRRILLIEDDPSIREAIAHQLTQDGFELDWIGDGAAGLEKALEGDYALVILDLNLPKLSGLEVCRGIRRMRPALPIIMLTSRDSEMDRVIGLETGADDYMVKPFSVYEMMARIRARLRIVDERTAGGSGERVLHCGPIRMDTATRAVTVKEQPLELTKKEYELLEYLMRNQGRTVSREELLEFVWGSKTRSYDETVTTIVGRVRRKIEAIEPAAVVFQTIRGVGFSLSVSSPLDVQARDKSE